MQELAELIKAFGTLLWPVVFLVLGLIYTSVLWGAKDDERKK